MNNTRIFKIHNRLYLGLGGLLTDVQTVSQILAFRHKLYRLREKRNMSPEAFTKVVSNLLYSKRFGPYFVDPIIIGICDDGEPFVSSMDLIGATEISDNFACVGTTDDELYGICENLWNKNMVLLSYLFYFCSFVFCVLLLQQTKILARKHDKKNFKEAEDLFETISQSHLSAVDRDCLAGWGAVVYVLSNNKVVISELKARQD